MSHVGFKSGLVVAAITLFASGLVFCGRAEPDVMTLELTCGTVPSPAVTATLQNRTASDARVVIGLRLWNGTRWPSAVRLQYRAAGATQWQEFRHGGFPVAGRVDPWVVSVPASGSFSFPIELKKFVTVASSGSFTSLIEPGTLRLVLEAEPLRAMNLNDPPNEGPPIWTGVLSSDLLRVPDDCKRGG
jgi:hypothetical protein